MVKRKGRNSYSRESVNVDFLYHMYKRDEVIYNDYLNGLVVDAAPHSGGLLTRS